METTKPVAGQDFSVNPEATAKNAAGETVTAKEVLCAELPAALLALDAGAALTKNFWVKIIIQMVKNALEALGATYCPPTK